MEMKPESWAETVHSPWPLVPDGGLLEVGLYAQSCAAEMRHDGGYAGRGWSRWTVHRWMKVGMSEQVDRQVTVTSAVGSEQSWHSWEYQKFSIGSSIHTWDIPLRCQSVGPSTLTATCSLLQRIQMNKMCLFFSLECPVILRTGFPDMILINSWNPTIPVTWITL